MTAAPALARHWWVLVVRGVAAILFGVLALAWPGLTLATLVLVFVAYMLADGILAVAGAVRHGLRWPLVGGLASLAAGLVAVAHPALTAVVLVYLVGAWAIARGVLEIATAVRLRRVIAHEWSLGASGLASIVLGLLLIAFPGAGALSLAWLIGLFAVALGALLVAAGLRLRGRLAG